MADHDQTGPALPQAGDHPAQTQQVPLTPRIGPLDRHQRREARKALETWDPEKLSGDLLAYVTALQQVHQALESNVRNLRPRILYSGTAQLDANGTWRRTAGGNSSSLWVFSPSVPLTVVAGPGQTGSAPGAGAGVFQVPPLKGLMLNARTSEWTLYGAGPAESSAGTIQVPNPAAAADWSYTLTQPTQIESVSALLTTSATVASRNPILQIKTASGLVIADLAIGSTSVGAVIPASEAYMLTWGQGLAMAGNSTVLIGTGPFPGPMTLPAGTVISTLTNSIQAGDQWSNIAITGVTDGGIPASAAGALVDVTIFSHATDPGLAGD